MGGRRSDEATAELRDSLLLRASEVVRAEGAPALTMRRLAAAAGCSPGLIYKVFDDRDELIVALVRRELQRLAADMEDWVATAGSGSLAANLDAYASILLDSTTPALVHAAGMAEGVASEHVGSLTPLTGLTDALDSAVRRHLAVEQELGRVRPDADVAAFGFLVTGAIHNLVTAGASYPRPSRQELSRILHGVAASLEPETPADHRRTGGRTGGRRGR